MTLAANQRPSFAVHKDFYYGDGMRWVNECQCIPGDHLKIAGEMDVHYPKYGLIWFIGVYSRFSSMLRYNSAYRSYSSVAKISLLHHFGG